VKPDEESVHSFIIRLWSEDSDHSRSGLWRGHITHLPGGEQQYFQSLSEIVVFIAGYLKKMNARIGRWERLRQRLRRWNES
jgi:hypothetical protein